MNNNNNNVVALTTYKMIGCTGEVCVSNEEIVCTGTLNECLDYLDEINTSSCTSIDRGAKEVRCVYTTPNGAVMNNYTIKMV